MTWSDGDLWHVTLDLDAGKVYEYKYVVMAWDNRHAQYWQDGGNSIVALQWGDEEVEVRDNWWNAPGAVVVTNGDESTRERKLLAWAGDYLAQRAELKTIKMELKEARREIRNLRAELGAKRTENFETENRNRELQDQISDLRRRLDAGRARTRSTLAEASRLLDLMDASEEGASEEKPKGQQSPFGAGAGGLFELLSGFNPLGRPAAAPAAAPPAPRAASAAAPGAAANGANSAASTQAAAGSQATSGGSVVGSPWGGVSYGNGNGNGPASKAAKAAPAAPSTSSTSRKL